MAITRRPGEPFFVCRLEFAMNRSDLALGIDEHKRTVKAVAAPVCRPFNTAHHNGHFIFSCQFGQGIEMTGFYLDRLLHVMGVDFLLEGQIKAGTIGEFDPEWIAGQQRFAKYDQATTLIGCPLGVFNGLMDSFLSI
jgi:hypothetical protein